MKYDLCSFTISTIEKVTFRTQVSFSCWRDSVGGIMYECNVSSMGFEEVLDWHDLETLKDNAVTTTVPYDLLC